MNLEEILKQVQDISAHPPDPNEEGNLSYGVTWSLKNEVCRIAHTLVERVKEAEEILEKTEFYSNEATTEYMNYKRKWGAK